MTSTVRRRVVNVGPVTDSCITVFSKKYFLLRNFLLYFDSIIAVVVSYVIFVDVFCRVC